MDLLHIAVLALVQGLTGFLPVSPEAHGILLPALFGWATPSLQARIGIHAGLLLAGGAYLYREVGSLLLGLFHLTMGRRTAQARLAVHLVIGTMPFVTAAVTVLVFGYRGFAPGPHAIAWTLIGFGVVLWLMDRVGMTLRRLEHLSGNAALAIGFAQVLALIPGVGRAAAAITAARTLGFERLDAARFAVLLGLPPLLGSAGWDAYQLAATGSETLSADAAIAAGLAFAGALVSINTMLGWLARSTFAPFAAYRVLAGAGALVWLYYAGT